VKKTILIVDDDNSLLSIFEFILKQAGYEAITACSGEECLSILSTGKEIDLIFLDLKMPDISGLKTFRSIHKTWPAIPTIMMTGYAIDKLLEEAFELGAYGIIYKPFDVEEVLSIVNKIFEIHTPVL
jgi:DNA-binding NtrC family response regulator